MHTIKILPPRPTICSGKTKKSKYLRSSFCEKDRETMINFLLKEDQYTHPGETASDNPTESKGCCCCCESSSFPAEDAPWMGRFRSSSSLWSLCDSHPLHSSLGSCTDEPDT